MGCIERLRLVRSGRLFADYFDVRILLQSVVSTLAALEFSGGTERALENRDVAAATDLVEESGEQLVCRLYAIGSDVCC